MTCRSETFEIPVKLPGLNDYTRANRMNPYAGANMKKTQEQVLKLYIMNALKRGLITKHKKPVRLEFIWTEKDMRRDGDNISFATKFVQDAMVACGVFPDDSRKYIKALSHEFVKGDHYGVTVTILEEE